MITMESTMKQKIKDYVKCAVGNRFTLGRHLAMGLSPLLGFIEYSITKKFPVASVGLFEAGFFSLFMTNYGLDTLNTYKKTKEHIQQHKTIDPRFKDKYSKLYCNQVGIKLAAEEAGLEHLI